MSKAKRIVEEILKDLKDRGGLSDEWDAIDRSTQTEIVKEWEGIVKEVLADDEVKKSLQNLLELDENGFLHRDKLDTEEYFKKARAALKASEED